MRDGPLNIALLWSRVSGVNTPEVSTSEARGPSPRFRVPYGRRESRTARLPDCRCTGDQLTPCGAEPVNLRVAAHRTTRSAYETPTTTLVSSISLQPMFANGVDPIRDGDAPDETERAPGRTNDALDLDRRLQDRTQADHRAAFISGRGRGPARARPAGAGRRPARGRTPGGSPPAAGRAACPRAGATASPRRSAGGR